MENETSATCELSQQKSARPLPDCFSRTALVLLALAFLGLVAARLAYPQPLLAPILPL